MPIAIEAPANRTEGLKNFVAMIANALERGDVEEAKRITTDLYQDIDSAYVCKEDEEKESDFFPSYDPETDGDYASWLVNNNID